MNLSCTEDNQQVTSSVLFDWWRDAKGNSASQAIIMKFVVTVRWK